MRKYSFSKKGSDGVLKKVRWWVEHTLREKCRVGTGEYFPPLQFTCRNCGSGDRGRVAIYRPFGEVSLSLNRTVTCMVLKANDRRTSCPCHDEFRGPRSDYVRQFTNPLDTQLLCGSVLRFQASDLGFKPLAGQGRLSLTSLQWVDKWVPSMIGN
ncbi:uncharacterized protein TNCV_4046521 [Trichonephila clavipes]|nr:uncharacterized protein TNCV_4046521 [Trichonephila clavipes]